MNANSDRRRLLLILLAGISLLTGLWAGLARLGWLLRLPNEQFVTMHGPLMVVGFPRHVDRSRKGRSLEELVGLRHPSLCRFERDHGVVCPADSNKRVSGRRGRYTSHRSFRRALLSISFRTFHHHGAKRACLAIRQHPVACRCSVLFHRSLVGRILGVDDCRRKAGAVTP